MQHKQQHNGTPSVQQKQQKKNKEMGYYATDGD